MPILQRLSTAPPTAKSKALPEYVAELRKAVDRPQHWSIEELGDLCGVKKITMYQLMKDILAPDDVRKVGKAKLDVIFGKHARKIGEEYAAGKIYRSEARASEN